MLNKFIPYVLSAIVFSGFPTYCPADTKTITRTEDPVVVKGKVLGDFLGSKPDKLALLKYKNGQFEPVPFQIDQVSPTGDYVFSAGKTNDIIHTPGLDENDELVFMINDSGDKAPLPEKPENSVQCKIIELTDPISHEKGWVYLCRFNDSPPVSEKDYVDLSFTNQYMIYTLRNKTGDNLAIFSQPRHATLPDRLQRFLPGGGLEEDMIDRMKCRVRIKFKILPQIKVALDGRVHADFDGWTDGPVRLITKCRTHVRMGVIKLGINAFYHVAVYRNGIHTIVEMISTGKSHLSTNSFILKNASVYAYMDFTQNMLNHHIYSEHNPASINAILDGKNTPDKDRLDFDKTINWIAGYGDKGGIMARIFVPENWDHIRRTLYLNENLNKSVKPEDHKGELGVGWQVSKVESIASDKGTLGVWIYYFEQGFMPPMENDILNIYDHPVVVDILDEY